MKILCISDTHQKHSRLQLTECDVLIVAGDMCSSGDISEFEFFVSWLKTQADKFKKAILVAGNHDWCFMRHRSFCVDVLHNNFLDKVVYLEDSSVVIDGIKFHGSPWQPEHNRWAFNVPRGDRLKGIWSTIPDDTQVLITHCPAHGIGDMVSNTHLGCVDLFNRVVELSKNELFLHVFGHIHSSSGDYTSEAIRGVNFCNAAICTEEYIPENLAHEYTICSAGTHTFMACNFVDLVRTS